MAHESAPEIVDGDKYKGINLSAGDKDISKADCVKYIKTTTDRLFMRSLYMRDPMKSRKEMVNDGRTVKQAKKERNNHESSLL